MFIINNNRIEINVNSNVLLCNIFQAIRFLSQYRHRILEAFSCQQNDLSFSLVPCMVWMQHPQPINLSHKKDTGFVNYCNSVNSQRYKILLILTQVFNAVMNIQKF